MKRTRIQGFVVSASALILSVLAVVPAEAVRLSEDTANKKERTEADTTLTRKDGVQPQHKDQPVRTGDALLQTTSAPPAEGAVSPEGVPVVSKDFARKPKADTMQAFTVADTLQADSVKKGFFHRFYNYFKTANVDKTLTKKFDFSIIGGPHYSSDIKLGLGLVAAGLYRVDRKDLSIPPSNVSLFGDITTTGFWLLGVRGNTLFKSAKYRLDYTLYFFSFPSAFWGIGYDKGMYGTPGTYKRLQSQVKVDFLFRLTSKRLYLGPTVSFNYIEGKEFSDISLLNGEATKFINTGVGAILLYDSRDIIYNASRGIYAKIDQRFYPSLLGNKGVFSQTEITFDAYHRVWKGATLCYDLHAQFSGGDVPWTMLARMGGSYRMRGYYEGRYRDRQMVEVQAELRQHIYNRHGVAAWVGAGNVFSSFGKFNPAHTLPNYGIGYRWEFKNKVNVRFDYGFGKGENCFLFSINEAF